MSSVSDAANVGQGLQAQRTEAEETNRYTEQALLEHKRDGLWLAVRARWVALAVTAVMLPFLNPNIEVLYYECALGLFALIGWAQLKVWRVGQSRAELFLLWCDLALLTIVATVPNPFRVGDMPTAMQFRFDTFYYFYIFLAAGTLSYSWRTVVAIGTWTTGLWLAGATLIYFFGDTAAGLTEAVSRAVGGDDHMVEILNPNAVQFDQRVQEVVIFLLVAGTLALGVRRYTELLNRQASAERERSNLARYFSPNVVAELSKADEPLKSVRTQDVAVLFVDIVGFTSFAETRSPEDVIKTLREFHGRMEAEVFRHNGTLDKYLGDGLMATFGTPFTTDNDASNAVACAKAMVEAVDLWNQQRTRAGEPPIRASFGVHYGEVTLGDIGSNRLEFSVIGNTVNVASRLESLTRKLDCSLIVSDDVLERAADEHKSADPLPGFSRKPKQRIRGLEQPITIWAYGQAG
ncbi:MAG: adenylate/guanylate cyclase domain-containing protein [Pseudomonadota bacterium]